MFDIGNLEDLDWSEFTRSCTYCGRSFQYASWDYDLGRVKICSDQCREMIKRGRSRTYANRPPISMETRLIIFNRDQWRCQICGTDLDPDRDWPDPRTPVIDHVVPIKFGGTDDRANLQAAHNRCNMIKGDRVNFRCGPPSVGETSRARR